MTEFPPKYLIQVKNLLFITRKTTQSPWHFFCIFENKETLYENFGESWDKYLEKS